MAPSSRPQVDIPGALLLIALLGAGTALVARVVTGRGVGLGAEIALAIFGGAIAGFLLPARGLTLAASFGGAVTVVLAGASLAVFAGRRLVHRLRRSKHPQWSKKHDG
jgi:hypothetical protein